MKMNPVSWLKKKRQSGLSWELLLFKKCDEAMIVVEKSEKLFDDALIYIIKMSFTYITISGSLSRSNDIDWLFRCC